MPSKLQIVGFLFATLTLSGVALAQQGGGGGGGSSGDAGGGDDSVIAVRLKDQERLRVPRASQTRAAGSNCITHACNEPPQRAQPVTYAADNCGGDYVVARDRQGRIVRRICQFN
ncbi:Flagellar motor switch protein FliM [Hyphomicrobiales bacterium]|nr:Flagellar motor switch protein FliM [Hyphomicrobiales bacterium]CAH1701253.1 Flagellar motor switch protein FliM [Hyphomicrobiales bacterium]CAI0345216.1 conserved exported hypothetical protein [Hyphomicrobiales bacterium]